VEDQSLMPSAGIHTERRVVPQIVALLFRLCLGRLRGSKPSPVARRKMHADKTGGRIDDHAGIAFDLAHQLAVVSALLTFHFVAPEPDHRSRFRRHVHRGNALPHARWPPPVYAARLTVSGGEAILFVAARTRSANVRLNLAPVRSTLRPANDSNAIRPVSRSAWYRPHDPVMR
jgi:hypothetical protein